MTSDLDSHAGAPGQPGQGGRFPLTRPSAIGGVASDDPKERARAFDILVRAYWKPVYKHVRIKWRRPVEDARDVTQGFFARTFEKRQLVGYDPARARFRTYLKGSLDHYVAELARNASRQKRGGGALRVSLDFDVAEDELVRSGAVASALAGGPAADARADACFDHEWTRSLFDAALLALEARCHADGKAIYFEVFRRYVVEPTLSGGVRGAPEQGRPSYASVAAACGIAVTDVTNYLSWTRRELRLCVLEELREITADETEFKEEARAALGIDASLIP